MIRRRSTADSLTAGASLRDVLAFGAAVFFATALTAGAAAALRFVTAFGAVSATRAVRVVFAGAFAAVFAAIFVFGAAAARVFGAGEGAGVFVAFGATFFAGAFFTAAVFFGAAAGAVTLAGLLAMACSSCCHASENIIRILSAIYDTFQNSA
ncbi:hypothetical protein [Acetobacter musti]|uniref:hypothetical protein n=1 Tax=Acetobacter musti TaxID=864732 RepID=UPI00156ADA78|nr:hypothetical protein [Acetobacter musti]